MPESPPTADSHAEFFSLITDGDRDASSEVTMKAESRDTGAASASDAVEKLRHITGRNVGGAWRKFY